MENKRSFSAARGAALTRKGENILVGVLAAAFLTAILIIFGYRTLELWFASPIVWNDPDTLQLQLWEKEELGTNMKLTFNVLNASDESYTDYTFYAIYGTSILNISSFRNPPIRAHDGQWLTESFAQGGSVGRLFNALSGKSVAEINQKMTFHVKELNQYGDNGYHTNGWLKIVVIMVLSAVCGVLSIQNFIRWQPLRIVLKLLCVPALLPAVVFGLLLAGAGEHAASPAHQQDADDGVRRRAAERYKEMARDRANALKGGSARDAARAQGHMDQALADMITGSQSSVKKEAFKQQAMLKAGAAMSGKTRDAARAQGRMDELLADMLRDQGEE